MIHWAWVEGMAGRNYRDTRDNAANAGTMAHAAIDAHIRGQEPTFEGEPEIVEKARVAFQAFLDWSEQTQLRVTHTELQLVSETYRFGGTMDAMLVRNGRAVCDWKTSNACYPEYLIQIAAYGQLWTENFPDEPITAGYHLLRFDKKYGDFHAHWWSELNSAWWAFRHLRELWDLDQELKERAA